MDETIIRSSPYQPQDQMINSVQDRAHNVATSDNAKEILKYEGYDFWKRIMGDTTIPPRHQILGLGPDSPQGRVHNSALPAVGSDTKYTDSEKMTPEMKQARPVTAFVAHFKFKGLEPLRHYINIDDRDKVVELWKDTMGGAEIPLWYHIKGEMRIADRNDKKDAGSEKMTPNARFMRAFAGNLKTEGLRSPHYYHDKSQCLSFHENASPAEMGYLKARSLKRGYIEPEELISRLQELKPSDNFTLRKYRHPWMEWAKSPVKESSYVVQPPPASWFSSQLNYINEMQSQLRCRLGKRTDKLYKKELEDAADHWEKVYDIELAPLPDLHLLKDMGRSPSGTLFPRYLVKGLHGLRELANERGDEYYAQEYEKAKVKRSDAIRRWQNKNPDAILADDPLSIYRTWPSDLMDELDALDRDAIRCGNRHYMADLLETEKKMQKLVDFWRDCGLVNGERTPPSPQWPDPKAKLRGKYWPDYLSQRVQALTVEFQQSRNSKEFQFSRNSKEYCKREFIEITRWKEAILNADVEPSASDTPFPQFLMNELDIVWQDYDFLRPEETEDEMIMRMARWRKSKHDKSSTEVSRTASQPNPDANSGETVEKTQSTDLAIKESLLPNGEGNMSWIGRPSHSDSTDSESIDSISCQESTTSITDQSSATTADVVDGKACSVIPRLNPVSKSGNQLCIHGEPSEMSQLQSREASTEVETATPKSIWSGRLRSKRKTPETTRSPGQRPQGIVKRSEKKPPKKRQRRATKDSTTRLSEQKPLSPSISGSLHHINGPAPEATPAGVKETKKTKRPQLRHPDPSKLAPLQGVRKARISKFQ
ncbi:MAG: hypothetical protein Q9187_004360, partial [Circinaria calcarea]